MSCFRSTSRPLDATFPGTLPPPPGTQSAFWRAVCAEPLLVDGSLVCAAAAAALDVVACVGHSKALRIDSGAHAPHPPVRGDGLPPLVQLVVRSAPPAPDAKPPREAGDWVVILHEEDAARVAMCCITGWGPVSLTPEERISASALNPWLRGVCASLPRSVATGAGIRRELNSDLRRLWGPDLCTDGAEDAQTAPKMDDPVLTIMAHTLYRLYAADHSICAADAYLLWPLFQRILTDGSRAHRHTALHPADASPLRVPGVWRPLCHSLEALALEVRHLIRRVFLSGKPWNHREYGIHSQAAADAVTLLGPCSDRIVAAASTEAQWMAPALYEAQVLCADDAERVVRTGCTQGALKGWRHAAQDMYTRCGRDVASVLVRGITHEQVSALLRRVPRTPGGKPQAVALHVWEGGDSGGAVVSSVLCSAPMPVLRAVALLSHADPDWTDAVAHPMQRAPLAPALWQEMVECQSVACWRILWRCMHPWMHRAHHAPESKRCMDPGHLALALAESAEHGGTRGARARRVMQWIRLFASQARGWLLHKDPSRVRAMCELLALNTYSEPVMAEATVSLVWNATMCRQGRPWAQQLACMRAVRRACRPNGPVPPKPAGRAAAATRGTRIRTATDHAACAWPLVGARSTGNAAPHGGRGPRVLDAAVASTCDGASTEALARVHAVLLDALCFCEAASTGRLCTPQPDEVRGAEPILCSIGSRRAWGMLDALVLPRLAAGCPVSADVRATFVGGHGALRLQDFSGLRALPDDAPPACVGKAIKATATRSGAPDPGAVAGRRPVPARPPSVSRASMRRKQPDTVVPDGTRDKKRARHQQDAREFVHSVSANGSGPMLPYVPRAM